MDTSINLTLVRRNNVHLLFQDFTQQAINQGLPAKGLEQMFAQSIQISPSLWSQIKSSRPIGNKLARQIESACKKPQNWLDEPKKEAQTLSDLQAQQRFLQLALGVWQKNSPQVRKELISYLKKQISAKPK